MATKSTPKPIIIEQIPADKSHELPVGHSAEIIKGVSIRLFGLTTVNHGRQDNDVFGTYSNTFRIGDTAEYSSYNLRYLGKITAITEKTVTILEDDNRTVHRMSLCAFDHRNYDFNLVEALRHNEEEMKCI